MWALNSGVKTHIRDEAWRVFVRLPFQIKLADFDGNQDVFAHKRYVNAVKNLTESWLFDGRLAAREPSQGLRPSKRVHITPGW